ncbi:MAG: hypothetical protein Q8S38_02760 [Bosea sp. (in: a-proteobacteria)]|nr:hypothetical protein [Bosea sp. (in: a-proteobacteria)]MDP3407196.1 hypothetical protein [Bosea sp. (in: a-proteobacteria)]
MTTRLEGEPGAFRRRDQGVGREMVDMGEVKLLQWIGPCGRRIGHLDMDEPVLRQPVRQAAERIDGLAQMLQHMLRRDQVEGCGRKIGVLPGGADDAGAIGRAGIAGEIAPRLDARRLVAGLREDVEELARAGAQIENLRARAQIACQQIEARRCLGPAALDMKARRRAVAGELVIETVVRGVIPPEFVLAGHRVGSQQAAAIATDGGQRFQAPVVAADHGHRRLAAEIAGTTLATIGVGDERDMAEKSGGDPVHEADLVVTLQTGPRFPA